MLESHCVFSHSLLPLIYFSSPDHNPKRNFSEAEDRSSLINSYRREMNLPRINCTFSSLIQTIFSLKMLLLSELKPFSLMGPNFLGLIFISAAARGCMVQRGGKFKSADLGQRLTFRGEGNSFDCQISDVMHSYHDFPVKVYT